MLEKELNFELSYDFFVTYEQHIYTIHSEPDALIRKWPSIVFYFFKLNL